jgi:hypothetical protein
MIRKLCHVMAIVAAIATVDSVPVAAEPVTILGGVLVYSRQNQAVFDLQLVDGSMRGEFGSSSESWDPPHACFPCAPGSVIDLSLSESMPQSEDVTVGGALSFQGTEYFVTNLSFTIDSDPVRVPGANAFRGGENSVVRSTVAQFVLRGLVQSQRPNGSSGAGVGLLGYGKANVLFLSDGSWFSTTYKFEDPAAVPEPATLLLFGPVAAGAVARWRGRRIPGCGSGVRDPIRD